MPSSLSNIYCLYFSVDNCPFSPRAPSMDNFFHISFLGSLHIHNINFWFNVQPAKIFLYSVDCEIIILHIHVSFRESNFFHLLLGKVMGEYWSYLLITNLICMSISCFICTYTHIYTHVAMSSPFLFFLFIY